MNSKQKWLIGGAIALVVVLIAAAFAWFAGDDTEPDAPTAQPTTPAVPTQGNNGGTGFADPATDTFGRKIYVPNNPAGQSLPQRDPGARVECDPGQLPTTQGGMTIQRNFDMVMLYSETDGPTRVDGDLARGYSHSPQGAALAAWNIWHRMREGGDVTKQVLLEQTVHDAALQKELETNPVPPGLRTVEQKRSMVAPDGFRILSCDDDFVVLEYAVRQIADENGALAAPRWVGMQWSMLWRDGDWKMQTADDSGKSGAVHTTLDGFTTWQF